MAKTALGIVRKALVAAGPVLFPHFCLGCGEEGPLLCIACTRKMTPPFAKGGVLLPEQQKVDGLDGVICMAPYKDPLLRELLQAYKYEGVHEAGRLLADLFAVFLRDRAGELHRLAGPDAVILPSPLHPFRFRLRGFNQADLFADALAAACLPAGRSTGYAVDRTLLRRAYSRKTQVEMGEDEARVGNVHDAVAALRAAPASCILVDDVLTTGSTLRACANALRDAGARRVVAVTVLHG